MQPGDTRKAGPPAPNLFTVLIEPRHTCVGGQCTHRPFRSLGHGPSGTIAIRLGVSVEAEDALVSAATARAMRAATMLFVYRERLLNPANLPARPLRPARAVSSARPYSGLNTFMANGPRFLPWQTCSRPSPDFSRVGSQHFGRVDQRQQVVDLEGQIVGLARVGSSRLLPPHSMLRSAYAETHTRGDNRLTVSRKRLWLLVTSRPGWRLRASTGAARAADQGTEPGILRARFVRPGGDAGGRGEATGPPAWDRHREQARAKPGPATARGALPEFPRQEA